MRKSRYTISAPGRGGEHLIFNSANGAFGALDDDAWKLLEPLIGQGLEGDWPCESLAGAMSDDGAAAALASKLLDAGFFTDLDAAEELERVNEIFDAQRANTEVLDLAIAPTYECNCNCAYCYQRQYAMPGIMGQDVMDAIFDFVIERHEHTGFKRMYVLWYGGEPLFAKDVVEELSARLIDWCDSRDIEYGSMMLSNCLAIDEEVVYLLQRCRVGEVFVTVDGTEEIHDSRRHAKDGRGTFARQLEAMRLFAGAGITIRANMNMDKVNKDSFPIIARMLSDELGVTLTSTMLCDYGHTFGEGEFRAPEFDLFCHSEFAKWSHDLAAKTGFTLEYLQNKLSPNQRFCRGQRENYFVVDSRGDVYKCDGYMGERQWALFNVLDGHDEAQMHEVVFDAGRDNKCSMCDLLPLCRGNCIWERRKTEMPCHPLRYTISDYLADYRALFGGGVDGFRLFVKPNANGLGTAAYTMGAAAQAL